MSLKELCIQNIVNQIKNLPPILLEEVVKASLKTIKEDAKKEAMREIRRSAAVFVDDITERMINSKKTGDDWKRPDYTMDIDDELYFTFVETAETFVNKHEETLVFGDRRISSFYTTVSDSDDY